MKYLEEFRDPTLALPLIEAIRRTATHRWVLMEVCGGQTHAIVKHGIDQLLQEQVELVHGPGCPVCVTSLATIDAALTIAAQPGVIFTSFGDMLRVPGSQGDLFGVKSRGGDVRVVYSPLDAVKLARAHPDRRVVFFAVGFETTAPTTAMAVWQARKQGVTNFFLLVSHVLVPPAITALLQSPDKRVQGYLAAGHVCAVTGWEAYVPLATKYEVPIVVTGFEPVDLLDGILAAVRQLERGEARVENRYARVVSEQGNRQAQDLMHEVFEIRDCTWRGIGVIRQSGLKLREDYATFDAEREFSVAVSAAPESGECQSGLILQGISKPVECPAFGTRCTPAHPLGATMVSSEGVCAAYYRYNRAPGEAARE